MKTLKVLLVAILITLSSNLFAKVVPSDSIKHETSSSQSELIMLRVEKDKIGSEIMVFHSSGDLVMSKIVKRKKMIIDLSEVKYGTYTIILMKDGAEVESFTFVKELILSQIPR